MSNKLLFFVITLVIMQTPIVAQTNDANKSYSDYIGSGDFYPFQDKVTNYWGVKCREEIVVGALYDSIKIWNGWPKYCSSFTDGKLKSWNEKRKLFTFRENNKWGLLSVNSVLIPPHYDDIEIHSVRLINSDYLICVYRENSKYGLMTIDGNKIIEAKYDSISAPQTCYVMKIKGLEFNPIAFLVKSDSVYKLISQDDITLLDNIENTALINYFENPYRFSSSGYKIKKAQEKKL